jgi:Cu/Ag efflux pump CusA
VAVFEAGQRRFRAVFVSSLTTVVGMMPILFERSSQAQSLKPMATALVFGLAFATGLTLLVIPSVYLIVNDARRFVRWLRYGGAYPTPEIVEEATRDRLAGVT